MLRRVRVVWRAGRSWPIIRDIVGALDRAWWAHVIHRAGIVDLPLVAAQLGRHVSRRVAVKTYVRGGFRTGLTLNALFVEETVRRQLPDQNRVPALYAYLVNDRRKLHVSPSWDAPAYAERIPESANDVAGPLGHAWRAAVSEGVIDLGSAEGMVRVAWPAAHARAIGAAVAAANLAHTDLGCDSKTYLDSTLICLVNAIEPFDRALTLAAQFASIDSSGSIIVAINPTGSFWIQASLLTEWATRVRVTAQRSENPDAVTDEVKNRADNGTVVVRGAGAVIELDVLQKLATESRRGPVAPLWLAPDGTIASAGVVSVAGTSIDLLQNHPQEDGRALGSEVTVHALAGSTYALTGSSMSSPPRTLLHVAVTAPLEARQLPVAGADTDLHSLLSPAGLGVRRSAAASTKFSIERPRLWTTSMGGERVPSLRWAIKTAAPAGAAGESWGDTHFARGLARALRRLGQDVVIDAYEARDRPTTRLDDVSLVLRGPRRIEPPPTGRSMLWIISHPNEITAKEVELFDRVFAASTPWSHSASKRFGRDIDSLLQCTDVTRFRPAGAVRNEGIVFVGTARGIARPVVVEPIRAGLPVRVFGPDWLGYIPATSIVADHISNRDLPALYESAEVVLNDHWPAMRDAGFISNRPYDAVAAGGRVISDHVDGIEEEFLGAVRTFAGTHDLLRMLEGDLDALFPEADALEQIASLVRERDSFDARARTLLTAALTHG